MKNPAASNAASNPLTRKQIRKQSRISKKVAKSYHYTHRLSTFPKNSKSTIHPLQVSATQAITKSDRNKKKRTPSLLQSSVKIEKQVRKYAASFQDEEIALYEKKLGIKSGKDKYSKIAKTFGYDDDLFDFLDGITNKATAQPAKRKGFPTQEAQPQQNQDFDQEYDKMFDSLGREGPATVKQAIKDSGNAVSLRKSMNSLFNKLSDGNLMLTFKQFVATFDSHPRSNSIPTFTELFMRFNLLVEKPLLHVLATNVALAAGLHQYIGNRLMTVLLQQLTAQFVGMASEEDDQAEVAEIGYSKVFERRKNYTLIVSYLYEFGSITGEFLESMVEYLAGSLSRTHIEFIYGLIEKSGFKMRQNDPAILKRVVERIKQAIKCYRCASLGADTDKKVDIIEIELNQLKFNRKNVFDADQRLGFLKTFLDKNVPQEVLSQQQILTSRFDELLHADTSQPNWWDTLHPDTAEDQPESQLVENCQQRNQLLELARSMHMVTEARRNIFVELMDSKDYLEATQRIIELKIKHLQDIATVIVEVCISEPTFNPFYALVAAKIASFMPKFRMNLQYAVWDHLKLVKEYPLRKTSNLAKFTGRIISEPMSNCSLSLLKFFNDLSNLKKDEHVFVKILLTEMLLKASCEYLSKLAFKLQEKNNRAMREDLKTYLSEFISEVVDSGKPKLVEKSKLLRRILMMEVAEEQEQEEQALLD